MKLPINKQVLKQAAKVGVAVGAGALLAQGGSSAVKRASSSAAAFAAKGPYQEAVVDAVSGVVLSGGALLIIGKVKPALAKQIAPFMVGGALMSAAAPVIAPKIAGYLDELISRVLPNAAAPQPLPAAPPTLQLVANAAAPGGSVFVSPHYGYGGLAPGGMNLRQGIGGVPGGANAVQKIGGLLG